LKEECVTYHSASDQETIELGRKLGTFLSNGDVIALVGELGSGKTWFTKGLALGLGVSPDTILTSPSFSLINDYKGRCTLFHMDVYRLERLSDLLSAGLEEYFYQDGVVAMEWADRWPEILPDWSLRVAFAIVDDRTRKITLSGSHPRAVEMLKKVVRCEIQNEICGLDDLE
jgi:tRNA threonylcarbamoyladenosine biosynthesis protein TsaE